MERIATMMCTKEFSYKEALETIKNCKTKKEAKMLLVEKHYNLAFSIANKFRNNEYVVKEKLYDEIEGYALLALAKAANSFDETKNTKFSTFANKCIINEILLYIKKTKKEIFCYSLDISLNPHDPDKDCYLKNIIAEKESNIDNFIIQEAFNSFKSDYKLNNTELALIKLKEEYEDTLTQDEISDKIGIARSYVSRLEKSMKIKYNNYNTKKIYTK